MKGMAKYKNLFEPAKIGKLEVKNRLIMLPMDTCLATSEGEVTDKYIAYYEERARGGVGTIIVEASEIVYCGGRGPANALSLHKDSLIAGLSELAEAIKFHGARAFIQLHHAGRQTTPLANEGMQPVAFSDIPCPLLKAPVRVLGIDEIKELEDAYAVAAERVKRAGFDGVEYHGAHGYLICQSLSPYSNKRTDEYGGSFENRMRFALNIIKKTRDMVGDDFPLSMRISVDEFVEGGLKVEDTIQIAKALEEAGIDIISCSAGVYETVYVPLDPYTYKDGWRVYLTEAIKKEVSIPVIACGLLRDPEMDEKILEEGRTDFIGLGRSLIADPEWPRKVMEGREEDIRKCIACDHCIGYRVFNGMRMICTVNPRAGRETTLGPIVPVMKPKKVIVVGGGAAGLEAARIAKGRGHEVTLFEKDNRLGGQLHAAAIPPNKYRITEFKDWLVRQVLKAGVKIELGKGVTADDISAMQPDVVILAVGSRPMMLTSQEVKGIDSDKVTNIYDVLEGKIEVGEKAVVYGGNMTALETAEFLAEKGRKVTVVYRRGQEFLARDLNDVIKMEWLPRLFSHPNIEFLLNSKIAEVTKDGAVVMDEEGKKRELKADRIILAIGIVPNKDLEQELRGMVSAEIYSIGDCGPFEPGTIRGAVYMGAKVAREI